MELTYFCTVLYIGLFLLFYLNVICTEKTGPVRFDGEYCWGVLNCVMFVYQRVYACMPKFSLLSASENKPILLTSHQYTNRTNVHAIPFLLYDYTCLVYPEALFEHLTADWPRITCNLWPRGQLRAIKVSGSRIIFLGSDNTKVIFKTDNIVCISDYNLWVIFSYPWLIYYR